MTQVLRAIPTRHKGILFRSKLEADWAITLDAFRVPWEYEPQGQYFGRVFYAPDFWLPRAGQWFEVKGKATAADMVKWDALMDYWQAPESPELHRQAVHYLGRDGFGSPQTVRVPIAVGWPGGSFSPIARPDFQAALIPGYGFVYVFDSWQPSVLHSAVIRSEVEPFPRFEKVDWYRCLTCELTEPADEDEFGA